MATTVTSPLVAEEIIVWDAEAEAFVPTAPDSRTIEANTIRALREIKPGQVLIYHTGDLLFDANPEDPRYPKVLRVAEEARRLAHQHKLQLTTRKYGKNNMPYTYIATGL